MAAKPAIPKVLSQQTAQMLLEAHGWTVATGGNHQVKMEKAGHRAITLPANKRRDYPPGWQPLSSGGLA